jgi:AraC family transcriptional regulator of adaptative response/methylated-DNA-[protein]-cysteine methyltransferase
VWHADGDVHLPVRPFHDSARQPRYEEGESVKQRLRKLLEGRDLDGVAEEAQRHRRTLGALLSLTFDPDPLIAWRAVEATGVAAQHIADDAPNVVREHLRRLFWLMSEESGGICWRAPETMAEIVRRRPDLFGDYIPIVVSLILELAEEDLDHFRGGVLWAIGRLGVLADDHIDHALSTITAALDHGDSQIRGTAVWCLEQVGRANLLAGRPALRSDEGTVELYEDGLLSRAVVRDLYHRALRGEPAER